MGGVSDLIIVGADETYSIYKYMSVGQQHYCECQVEKLEGEKGA